MSTVEHIEAGKVFSVFTTHAGVTYTATASTELPPYGEATPVTVSWTDRSATLYWTGCLLEDTQPGAALVRARLPSEVYLELDVELYEVFHMDYLASIEASRKERT